MTRPDPADRPVEEPRRPTNAQRVENHRVLLAAIVQWLKEGLGYPYDLGSSVLPPEPLRPLIELVWSEDEEPRYQADACRTVAEEGGWYSDDWQPPPTAAALVPSGEDPEVSGG